MQMLTRYRGRTGDDVIEDPKGDLVMYAEVEAVLKPMIVILKDYIQGLELMVAKSDGLEQRIIDAAFHRKAEAQRLLDALRGVE